MINCEKFLEIADQFKLGELDTEKPHPDTMNLSDLAKNDVAKAIEVLKKVDLKALKIMADKVDKLENLYIDIKKTLEANKKIFLFGCGSTGRLSIALEVFCREGLIPNQYKHLITGFMSGGDAALVRSIENFEDFPDRGARQLEELGFEDGDLLIASTEGGETPIVIGATEKAVEISKNAPYFLYCNPDEKLVQIVERSQRVIDNPNIKKICLAVGAMGLSGSTRMQSSTVLMAAIGFAFNKIKTGENIAEQLNELVDWYEQLDFSFVENLIHAEFNTYQSNHYVIYKTQNYGVSILTDTTERSPTFSLNPFENVLSKNDVMSLSYLAISNTKTAESAWFQVLKRQPKVLEWKYCVHLTGMNCLMGFDISENAVKNRQKSNLSAKQVLFSIDKENGFISFNIENVKGRIDIMGKNVLLQNLVLKMILNIHSTLLMGKLGRYESNVMTYVKPANNKLIDRAIRYVTQILEKKHGLNVSYVEIAHHLRTVSKQIAPEESIVEKTVAFILLKESKR